MLIKISGGSSGIKDYLENGQKQDRFYDRNQLDERVILNGDLNHIHQLTEGMESTSDKYFHITLAFKEDYIAPDVLEKIDNEFKDFFLKGYRDDEVDYYSEVHLPKIKSYETADGQTIVRKPHIHIVIPCENLLSGNVFEPRIEFNIKYIDSFQEATNAKYGLGSPKDNLRTTFNSSSEMISRYKGDEFNGAGKEERADILKLIIDKNPQSMNELKDLLSENGYEVKTRNNGKPDAYLNIKEVGKAKGINLKDSVFRDEFLSLSLDNKIAKINQVPEVKYHSAVEASQVQDKHLANLDEWNTYKALECKYKPNMSEKQRELYKDLSIEEKALHLETLQQKFYEKHQTKILESEIDEPRTNESILESIRETLDANERILTTIESDIARVGSIEVGNDRTKLKARLNRASETRHRDDITNSATIERPDPKSTALDEI
ncbi:MAG: relaxase/mobilization nuclease domain-containing protein, partial [Burkholderiales bacterium]|nr:relaxase/mobilization nuclease domain-containing protein [Burkholderiales bacterium]